MIINYYRNHIFIVLATINMIIDCDRKTFLVQATGFNHQKFYTSVTLPNLVCEYSKNMLLSGKHVNK
jgi:hypothetical protein